MKALDFFAGRRAFRKYVWMLQSNENPHFFKVRTPQRRKRNIPFRHMWS